MNYFRCTVGGSGKGNAVTVTCAEEFAGLTITLSKTGKTYTKTCPSTSPYVVTFYSVENGTYTVSATYDGRTYSESVVVKNIDCVLNYGFGWVTWVNTAQYLDASDYASLDEVLEDEAAIRELFLEHACVDYMAELTSSNEDLETVINNDLCAKWINLSDYALDFLGANTVIKALMDEADKYGYGEWALMPQVPTMTSNTAPFGTAFASSVYGSSNLAYHAFDGVDNTNNMWASDNNDVVGAYIGYTFTSAVKITEFVIHQFTERYATSVKVQGSNDGFVSDVNDISSAIDISASYAEKKRYSFSNNVAYTSYRLYVLANSGAVGAYDNVNIQYLQFYAWAPKGNVPVMTSNTAPYGTCIKDSEYTGTGRYAWCAFDDNESTFWSKSSTGNNAYIGYMFVNPINVRKVKVRALGSSSQPFVAKVQYSDDNSTWTDTGASLTVADTNVHYISVDDCGYHLYWRIYWTGTNVVFSTYTLQFYGRELKVSVPAMTSNTAPYGEAIGNNGGFTSGYYPWYAFDGTYTGQADSWVYAGNGSNIAYCGYKFTNSMVVKFVEFMTRNEQNSDIYTRAPKSMTLQGSNNGIDWVNLSDEGALSTPSNARDKTYTYAIDNALPYRYYRVLVNTVWDAAFVGVRKLQFYGLDYSEKEFEVGTTKKWLYDHGVELENIVNRNIDASNAVKESEQLKISSSTGNCGFVISALNLTGLNLVRAKVGLELSNLTNGCLFAYDGANAYRLFDVASCPNNQYLDVSAYNADTDLFFETYLNQATTLTLTEWWLE